MYLDRKMFMYEADYYVSPRLTTLFCISSLINLFFPFLHINSQFVNVSMNSIVIYRMLTIALNVGNIWLFSLCKSFIQKILVINLLVLCK